MLEIFLYLIALFLLDSKTTHSDEIIISKTNLNCFGLYLIYYQSQSLKYESHFYYDQVVKSKIKSYQKNLAKISLQEIYQLKTKFINNE